MNGFQILADTTHVLALAVLLYKLLKTRSAAGISGNTQILYAIVFCARYNDLLTSFISFYNTSMKTLFLSMTFFYIYLIFFRYKKTYEKNFDTCRIGYLAAPCLVLALILNEELSYFTVLWDFSLYLEAVAIIPQMVLISKAGRFEKYVVPYMVLLGSYRFLYIFNWIFRYVTENHNDPFSYCPGVIQTSIYLGFFIYYTLYIAGNPEINRHPDNLPEFVCDEKLLNEELSSEIPSVFIIGSENTNEHPIQIEQAKA